jgi:pyridoxal phosphate enzyme (YggS family)
LIFASHEKRTTRTLLSVLAAFDVPNLASKERTRTWGTRPKFLSALFFVIPLVPASVMSIAENIARIRERIAAAAQRAGRDADAITLMAVSKTFPVPALRDAYAAGIRVFGENRVQEFAAKTQGLRDLGDARWHMIGHLQSNKAATAAEIFHAIDSVDSVKLAEKLNDAAGTAMKKLSVLVEVNVGGEAAKSGVALDSPELDRLLAAAARLENLEIRGLMTVPPYSEDPEAARPYFRKLRELRERIAARNLPAVGMATLSMGMSHDFEVAIEEGSTCVRVGTAIFGERAKP